MPVHPHHGESPLHRTIDRMRLPYMWRIHVRVDADRCFHEMWTRYTSTLLLRAREKILPLSDLQQEHRQHGCSVPSNRAGH